MKIERNPAVVPAQVLTAVADHFRISEDDLVRHDRSQPLARWRQLAMHLMREVCGASYPEIARLLRRADHTTVMHGCVAIGRRLADGDTALRDHVYRIIEALGRLPKPVPESEPSEGDVSIEVASPYADARTLHVLVVRLVSIELGVSAVKINSRSKEPDALRARAVAMHLLRDIGWSFPAIGKSFGRDHSTVISALRQLEGQLSADRDFHALVIRIAAQFRRIPRFRELSSDPI